MNISALLHLHWEESLQRDSYLSCLVMIQLQKLFDLHLGHFHKLLNSFWWQGAEEMGQMELLLNVYAASKARGSIADFMGHCAVQPEEANHRLTPGLWLVCISRSPPSALIMATTTQAASQQLAEASDDESRLKFAKHSVGCLGCPIAFLCFCLNGNEAWPRGMQLN